MTSRQLAALAVRAAGVPPNSPSFNALVEKVTESIDAERAAFAVEITTARAEWYDSGDAIAALDELFSAMRKSWGAAHTQKKR